MGVPEAFCGERSLVLYLAHENPPRDSTRSAFELFLNYRQIGAVRPQIVVDGERYAVGLRDLLRESRGEKRTGGRERSRGGGRRIKGFSKRGTLSGLYGVVFAAAFDSILDLTALGIVDRESFGVDDRRFTVQADNVPNRNPGFDVLP